MFYINLTTGPKKLWICQLKSAENIATWVSLKTGKNPWKIHDMFMVNHHVPIIVPSTFPDVPYPLVNLYITMENHHFQPENPLFQWPFSIAMSQITRG